VEKFRTLDVYRNYVEWNTKEAQPYKLEQRKFLVELRGVAKDTTSHIDVRKVNGGNMYAVFDWDGLHKEGVYVKGEEEECDVIGGVCSEEEEEEG